MRSKFKWIYTLLVVFTMQFSFAQEKTVSGIVSDASGPIPGANVIVKGTNRGTQTDVDGKYSIKASQGETLVFSFVGQADQSKQIGAANSYNVTLKPDTKILDEVLITGSLGLKKKKEAFTSSQQVVKTAELTQAANPNVVRSLAGKVSGLQINNSSGGVNGGTRIQLRGFRSITGNNEALIVIDNSISSASVLQSLPPDVIDNVNVIKGQQGSALYGEQGSNGVIIVTTKKGSKGDKLTVSINSSVDFEDISFLPERQSKYGQGWDGTQVSYENGAWGELLDGSIRETGLIQANGLAYQLPYTAIKDNIKDFYKIGANYQNGLTLNFGGQDGYALLNASRQATDFIVDRDNLKRNSFLFKAGKRIGKWNFDGNVNYISTTTTQSDAENTLLELSQAAANIPIGLFANSGPDQGWNAYYANPYWVRNNDRLDRSSDFFNGSAAIGYKFTKNFDVSYNANIQTTGSDQQQHANEFLDLNNPGGGDTSQQSSYFNTQSKARNFYGDLLFNFNFKLTENLGLKLNIGNNIQDRFSKTISQGGTDLEIEGWYHIQNVLNPLQPRQLTNNTVRSRRFSNFANLDLDFKDYLFLNGTVRNDNSSAAVSYQNGEANIKNASYTYYSGGLSFVPTKAFGISDSKVLSASKVYLNYSKVGNSSPIFPYDLSDIGLLAAGFPFGSLSSYSFNPNPTNVTIKPEFVKTIEGGFSLGFFNDRLTIDASAYRSTVDNLISRIGASATSGIATLKDNIGTLENKGFEIDLGFTPIKTKDFTWSGRVGYSKYDTTIKELRGGASEILLFNGATVSNIVGGVYAVVGESFPMIKGTTFQRDDQGRVIVGSNGVPLINGALSNLGKATPDYIINFSNNFDFRGLRLSVQGDYRTGASFLSETKYNLTWSGHLTDSAEFDRDLGFVYPNSVVNTALPGATPVYTANEVNPSFPTLPITSASGYAPGTGIIDYYGAVSRVGENNLIDGTALKIREIALSYGLPSRFTDKLGISSLRFGFNLRNPFIILAKGNKGYADPEASNFYSGSNTNSSVRATNLNTSLNGVGYIQTGQYPSTKAYGFSVNLTF